MNPALMPDELGELVWQMALTSALAARQIRGGDTEVYELDARSELADLHEAVVVLASATAVVLDHLTGRPFQNPLILDQEGTP